MHREILRPSRVRNKVPWRCNRTKRLPRPTLQLQHLHLPPLWREIHQLDPPITRDGNQSLLANEIVGSVSTLHIRLTNPLISTLAEFTCEMDFLIVVEPADTDDAIAHIIRGTIPLLETALRGQELPGAQLVGEDILFPYRDGAEVIYDSEERPRLVEEEVIDRRTLNVRIELRIPVLEVRAFGRGIVRRHSGIESSSVSENLARRKRRVKCVGQRRRISQCPVRRPRKKTTIQLQPSRGDGDDRANPLRSAFRCASAVWARACAASSGTSASVARPCRDRLRFIAVNRRGSELRLSSDAR